MSTAEFRRESRVSRGWLWFGLLGGVVAWTVHIMLAYIIGEFGCQTAGGQTMVAGFTVVTWSIWILTVLAGAVAVGALWTANHSANLLQERGDDADGELPKRYLANAGVYLSGLSAFSIVVQSIPIIYYLRNC